MVHPTYGSSDLKTWYHVFRSFEQNFCSGDLKYKFSFLVNVNASPYILLGLSTISRSVEHNFLFNQSRPKIQHQALITTIFRSIGQHFLF